MKLFLALLVLLPTSIWAQELEPIIFSSKQDTPEVEYIGTAQTLSSKEIESYGADRAQDILSQLAGVEVNQTGVIGGQSTIFIRGAESRHTLVMIDGVKVYDTASISRSFNLSLLTLLDIEKIEVLKGSQSVLYGSDAIGGVINIITKKGEGANRVSLASGYMNQGAAAYTHNLDNGLFYLQGYYQQVDSFDDVYDGDEKDRKINKGITINSSLNFNKLDSTTTIKVNDDFSETDASDFATDLPVDDENAFAKVNQLLIKQSFDYRIDQGRNISMDFSLLRHDRLNATANGDLHYDGDLTQNEIRYNQKSDALNLVVGATQIKELYSDNNLDDLTLSSNELFFNTISKFNSLEFELGARGVFSNEYGEHGVYAIGVAKNLKDSQVFMTNKSGFKAPSLYQLYGEDSFGSYGNPDLEPEKSVTTEIGFKKWVENFKYQVVGFYSEVENFVDFDNTYVNVSGSTTNGVELSAEYFKNRNKIQFNYTHIKYNLSTDERPERRPSNMANMNYFFQYNDLHSFGASLNYRGERFEDIDDVEVALEEYYTLNLNYQYASSKNYTLKLNVVNVTDQNYELTKEYHVQRLGYLASIDYRF